MLLEEKEECQWTWEQQAADNGERDDGNKDEETTIDRIMRDLTGHG